jgi:hypothetical protein
MVGKEKLYLDHDGTLTYLKRGADGMPEEKYKNDLIEFVNFVYDNFEVIWCSGCAHDVIINNLLEQHINNDILDKIPYFEYGYYGPKSKSILSETRDFIFIDDDHCREEELYLREEGLEKNFIKANPRQENDLRRIMEILKKRYLVNNKIK